MCTRGARRAPVRAALVLSLLLLPQMGRADEDDLRLLVEDLTERVRELESAQGSDRQSGWPDVRVSGNADFLHRTGERHSVAPNGRFTVQNARLFFDIDLGWSADLLERPILEGSSLFIEWDIARYGFFINDLGSVYARLDGIAGQPWLNAKLGRFAIPFGEEYPLWYESRPENPLLDFSAGSLYNWDEGFELFGSFLENRLSYVVALMDGDDDVGGNTSSDVAIAGKLAFEPYRWLRISASGLHTGQLGNAANAARSALKIGWTQAVPFGSGTSVPSFEDGIEVADDPDPTIASLDGFETAVILRPWDYGRLWLAYGELFVRAGGDSRYDRDLRYWIAEGVLELGALAPLLEPFYLVSRYSAIGTFDSGKGYLLRALNGGRDLGFNTESVSVLSSGLGIRMTRKLTLKAQYTLVDFDLVRGAPLALRNDAKGRDWFGVGLSIGL